MCNKLSYSEGTFQSDIICIDTLNCFVWYDGPSLLECGRDIHWFPFNRCLVDCVSVWILGGTMVIPSLQRKCL